MSRKYIFVILVTAILSSCDSNALATQVNLAAEQEYTTVDNKKRRDVDGREKG